MILMSQALNRAGHTFVAPVDSSNIIPLILDGAANHTYQEADMSVALDGTTYTASFAGGDSSASTWFNTDEGRMDYVTMTGDFEVIAHNIGLATGATTGDVQFCGLAVWLSSLNYEFIVAGNRGATQTNCVEYKATVAGNSDVSDTGLNSILAHRCDMRVIRSGSTVTFDRRAVGAETWTSVPMGNLSPRVSFGTADVRVGLITYGYQTVAAFTSACDSLEVVSGSYT